MINKAIIIGRLGRDVEIRYIQSGAAVANFSVATSETWKDKEGKKQESTQWHNVIVWNKLAEVCAEYLSKGSMVAIIGKITYRDYEDKDGNKRHITEIVANEMQMLGGGKPKEQQAGKNPPPPKEDDNDIPF